MASTTVLIGSDEIQARQRPTHREQQLGRRNLLGALVASPAALSAAPAIAAEAGQDPHLEWERQIGRTVAELEALPDELPDSARQPYHDEQWRLEGLIMKTPAATIEGVMVQIRTIAAVIRIMASDYVDGRDLTCCGNMLATLEQLAGRA